MKEAPRNKAIDISESSMQTKELPFFQEYFFLELQTNNVI